MDLLFKEIKFNKKYAIQLVLIMDRAFVKKIYLQVRLFNLEPLAFTRKMNKLIRLLKNTQISQSVEKLLEHMQNVIILVAVVIL